VFYNQAIELISLVMSSEDGDSIFFRRAENNLPGYKMQHRRP